jgi:hypothetical protein
VRAPYQQPKKPAACLDWGEADVAVLVVLNREFAVSRVGVPAAVSKAAVSRDEVRTDFLVFLLHFVC